MESGGRAPNLIVRNKIDLLPDPAAESAPSILIPSIDVSCTRATGLAELERRIAELLMASPPGDDAGPGLAINLRHRELLAAGAEALDAARTGFLQRRPEELVMVDLREALDRLGQIIGAGAGEEILDRLFSRFCIGK